jgi:O-antigen ligase
MDRPFRFNTREMIVGGKVFRAQKLIGVTLPTGIGAAMVVGTLWIVPFLVFYQKPPLGAFYHEWTALICLCIAFSYAVSVEWRRKNTGALRLPFVCLVPLLLLAVFSLQLALGKLEYWQQLGFAGLYCLAAVMAMYLGFRFRELFGLELLVTAISWGVLVAGGTSTLIQILQFLDVSGAGFPFVIVCQNRGAFYANLAQPNHLATLEAIALAGAWYLHAKGRLGGFGVSAFSLLSIIGLVFTSSRTPWLFLPLLAVLGYLFFYRLPMGQRPPLWKWLIAIPAAFAVVSMTIAPLSEWVGIQFNGSLSRPEGFRLDGVRRMLWNDAVTIFLANPLLGVGVGEFAANQYLLIDRWDGGSASRHAHNFVLQLLAETGGLGTGAAIAGILVWLRHSKLWKFNQENFFIWSVFLFVGIHSMLEYPLWYLYFLVPTAFLMGLTDSKNFTLECVSGRSVCGAAVVLAWFATAGILLDYQKIEPAFGRQPLRPDPMRQAEIALKAKDSALFAPYGEFAYALQINPSTDQLDLTIAFYERLQGYLIDPQLQSRYASLLALKGRHDEALAHLERSRRFFPGAFVGDYARIVEFQRSPNPDLRKLAQLVLERYGQPAK